jgi:hypothetical protein
MLRKIIKILILAIIVFILAEVFLYKEPGFPDFKISHKEPEKIIEKPKEEVKIIDNENILLDVPFIAQAPFGEWENPVFQDACEEAALIISMLWLENKEFTKEQTRDEIKKMSDFELEKYGEYRDRSATDTVQLMKDYYGYYNIEAKYNIGIEDIKSELKQGNLVVVPVNGQILKNPYYTPPGPERHMLVIIGYNTKTKEFITNDSGTRQGKGFRYPEQQVFDSIRDYETGYHIPILEIRKTMIVVGPSSKVCFNENCFLTELAETQEERAKGLMNREKLGENMGMLFIFEEEGEYSFYMKNTLIPLDIIWINLGKQVIYISKNNQPCDETCESINPEINAKYVLELNAGVVDKINLKTRDNLIFEIK